MAAKNEKQLHKLNLKLKPPIFLRSVLVIVMYRSFSQATISVTTTVHFYRKYLDAAYGVTLYAADGIYRRHTDITVLHRLQKNLQAYGHVG